MTLAPLCLLPLYVRVVVPVLHCPQQLRGGPRATASAAQHVAAALLPLGSEALRMAGQVYGGGDGRGQSEGAGAGGSSSNYRSAGVAMPVSMLGVMVRPLLAAGAHVCCLHLRLKQHLVRCALAACL
jgi:hypothetical protein